MYDTVLIDVDTQNDFIAPEGTLHVPGSEAIVGHLLTLVAWAGKNGIPVISTVDAHVEDDPEFAQFPPHCVQGTWGQEKIPGTLLSPVKIVPQTSEMIDIAETLASSKQVVFETPTFSVFENLAAAKFLGEIETNRFVVCGVATDYCVKEAVEGLLETGRPIVLVTDAIASINAEEAKRVIAEFKRRGVQTAVTAEIVGK